MNRSIGTKRMQRRNRDHRRLVALQWFALQWLALSSAAALLALAGCSAQAGGALPPMTLGGALVDGAGLTQQDVKQLSIQHQFELVRERDAHMQRMLADLQHALDVEQCAWGEFGLVPELGPNAWSVGGMELHNSYFLSMWCWVHVGDESHNHQAVIDYFTKVGWPHELVDEGAKRRTVVADTGQGVVVSWASKPSGVQILQVMSKTYWGDAKALLREIALRIPSEPAHAGASVSQQRPEFPRWSDPIASDSLWGGDS